MANRKQIRKSTRFEVFKRDFFTCQYCGRSTGHLTIDHVEPRHRGGQHRWDNLVAACQQCNRTKGGRSALEANMNLRRRPAEPAATASYLFGRHVADNADWARYIDGW